VIRFGLVLKLTRDPEAVARDEDPVVDDGGARRVQRDAVGAERGGAAPAAELPRGAPVEADGGDALARARDVDAELEREHLAQRRDGEVDLGHLVADPCREVRELQAHRTPVDQPQPLHREDAPGPAETELARHLVIRSAEGAAEKPGGDILALGGQVPREGVEVEDNQIGNIVIKLPLPPGCLPTLWNKDAEYVASYLDSYPGYYKTADAGFKDEDGYLWIMSRTDDIINVAGHRLSTGALEEILAAHTDVAECAVIGVADELKGEVPLGLVVLKLGVDRAYEEIIAELIQLVRERIGPVASFKIATVVNRLPKTRSGKIVRGTIKKMADGVEYRIPPTIEDAAVIDEIRANLITLGYPRQT